MKKGNVKPAARFQRRRFGRTLKVTERSYSCVMGNNIVVVNKRRNDEIEISIPESCHSFRVLIPINHIHRGSGAIRGTS